MSVPQDDMPPRDTSFPVGCVLVEVRQCSCGNPVFYWGGDFRHLTSRCPDDWRNKEQHL